MRLAKERTLIKAVIVCALFLAPTVGHATLIVGDGVLGDFTADLVYNAINSTTATLSVTITNTSTPANGGFLTAFAFNNPFNLITGVSLTASDADFGLLGGPAFDNGINAMPMGYFDIGTSTGGNFEGGGNPNLGLGVGQTGIFTFFLTGSSLDALSLADFISALSAQQGDSSQEFFAVRFRGFLNGGSDKVPGRELPPPIPEPSTLLLSGLGLLGASLLRKKH